MEEIRKEGHISTCIRKAIALGVPVAKAYKMGSYQAAEFYGLKNYGAIGAGYRADIVFLDDLEQVRPLDVMKDGRILTEEDYAKDYSVPVPDELLHTVHVGEVTKEKIRLSCDGKTDVIQMNPHQIVTNASGGGSAGRKRIFQTGWCIQQDLRGRASWKDRGDRCCAAERVWRQRRRSGDFRCT